ncbi:hypothetical protein BMS3Bbin04_00371 [bacterium BMS3Bbin04]|nr:hypothetical protein BMS3Bbin04_00371 [bacterium BMS3Bbin04]
MRCRGGRGGGLFLTGAAGLTASGAIVLTTSVWATEGAVSTVDSADRNTGGGVAGRSVFACFPASGGLAVGFSTTDFSAMGGSP